MVKDRITVIKGDITTMAVDAIVNAANSSLLGGGGVDGAIHHAAGPQLLAECEMIGGCQVGQAKITKGYKLPAKYVIHTVGPIWRGGSKGESKLLASCYASTLKLSLENNIQALAIPAISCGIYGYPLSQAATIAIKETANFLELNPLPEKIYFVCFDDAVLDAYQHTLDSLSHE